MKELLDIKSLSKQEIETIMSRAFEMKELIVNRDRCSLLKGKTVTTLFYENSTRTKTSFSLAASLVGAEVNSLDVATSSVQKGESLVDTGRTLDALGTDIVIIRHSISGTPLFLSKKINASVVNAGDGTHAHPTQALLDLMTMIEHFGSVDGLNVTIIGDVLHSRVARSNLETLKKMGANVTMCAPRTLLPMEMASKCNITTDPNEAVLGADVVMGLRMQLERQNNGPFPSLSEYHKLYGITHERLKLAKKHAVVMHPGPVNRGVEIAGDVLDSPVSLIDTQVTNGLAVRMSVLSLIGEER